MTKTKIDRWHKKSLQTGTVLLYPLAIRKSSSKIMLTIKNILLESLNILNDASIYLLFGFFVAGILHVFISAEKVARYLGENSYKSVIYAAILGIPIPLCSCGVVPTAISLKKDGASRGAVISFLISTPESGIDSIAITYALLDPVITIFRPFAAFFTATVAGLLTNLIPDEADDLKSDESQQLKAKHCYCEHDLDDGHSHGFKERFLSGITYGFVDLPADITGWLLIGILLAGTISYFIPHGFFENNIGSGISSMLVMLVIGIPLYICATASTPIAAAMILKGLNPGAALVFLLTGPATNIASITVVSKFLGKKGIIVYLLSIAFCSIAAGLFLNFIYYRAGIEPSAIAGKTEVLFPPLVKLTASISLGMLMIYSLFNTQNLGFK